jgi:hypothetical protein
MGCSTCDNEGVVCTRCKDASAWCDKRVCGAKRCPSCNGESRIFVRDIVGFPNPSPSHSIGASEEEGK